MLLTRWHETLKEFRDRPAIYEGDGIVTFADLEDALAQQPSRRGPVVAQGSAVEIAVATLRGWRDRQPVLPLETSGVPLPETVPDGVAHLKLTPGNAGIPRTVRFRATQIMADGDRLVHAMGLRPDVPNLAAISLSHSYGFSSILLPLLLHGIPIQTVAVPFPAVVAEAWNAHDRVTVPAVPSMWRAWQRSGILDQAPIDLAISAGAPLALDLERGIWEAHRLKIHNFYGASECGGISYDRSDTPRHHPDDLGEPLPGVDVAIDEEGRFLVRSDAVAIGYDTSRSTERLGDGLFQTPDHGHLEQGRLKLDSRSGDAINVAGRKLGPGRVETILRRTGLVKRVRVFGVPSPDAERVDEVAALIESDHDASTLSTAVSSTLAGWEIPRHWIREFEEGDWTCSRSALRRKHAGLA